MNDFADKNYNVIIEDWTEKHYCKLLEKKYKNHWDVTIKSIVNVLSKFDNLEGVVDGLEYIFSIDNYKVYKYYFKIAGQNKSAKDGGGRCILSVCKQELQINLLLIYTKDHIDEKNETIWWKRKIKNNYDFCKDIFLQ